MREAGAAQAPRSLDERRIQQVVFNLLSNAIKYTPSEGIITLSGAIQGEDVMIAAVATEPLQPSGAGLSSAFCQQNPGAC